MSVVRKSISLVNGEERAGSSNCAKDDTRQSPSAPRPQKLKIRTDKYERGMSPISPVDGKRMSDQPSLCLSERQRIKACCATDDLRHHDISSRWSASAR